MSAPLSGERLAEIAAREAAATAGPWMADGAEIYRAPWGYVVIDQWVGETLRIDDQGGSNADAAFIAHARTDVPALLAEVERLRTENQGHIDHAASLLVQLNAAERTVFRASHDSIVIGLYTTIEAAREHCEAYARREQPGAVLDWIADEDDDHSPQELAAQVGDQEDLTGYVVTPLVVASVFDADGDE